MMVRDEKALHEFERQYAARQEMLLSYAEAARVYEELWLRGREYGAAGDDDWLEAIEAEIEMARTLNALARP